MGWMEQGHLSKFCVCGSLRMNSTVWKNTSWRCTIWLKTESQAVVIPDRGKLRRHRDYRHGDVNCLSPMLEQGEQNEMRIGFRWYKKDTRFSFWVRLGHSKLLFYFLEGAFFLTVSKLWESFALFIVRLINGKTDISVLGLGGGLDPCGLGGHRCGSMKTACIWVTLADFWE